MWTNLGIAVAAALFAFWAGTLTKPRYSLKTEIAGSVMGGAVVFFILSVISQ